MIFDSFFMGDLKSSQDAAKITHLKDGLFFLKNYHSHPEGHQCSNELK